MDNKPSNTRELLIEELDLLRHTLDDGPEFQHSIPMLNEDNRDTNRSTPNSSTDLNADIPTLTDSYDETNTFTPEPPSLGSRPLGSSPLEQSSSDED